jgi:hypothetical protein
MKGSHRFPPVFKVEEEPDLLANRDSMRAFVYKLRPTRAQKTRLEQTLETCRRLYNRSLGERKDAWEQEQRSLGFAEQCAALPA